MLNLRTQCIHPTSQEPYIRTSSGGRDNSPEGQQVVILPRSCTSPPLSSFDRELQGGFSHGFVVEFENEDDRKYYLEKDPAHLSFVKSLDDIMQRARIVDYEPGVF